MVLNGKAVFKVLSVVMAVVGAAMLAPLAVALYYGESLSVKAFLVCALPLLAAGLLLVFLLPKTKTDISMKDGFFIVAFAWIAMSIFGALPFVISGDIPNFIDAFFETASGFSTTGSTILNDVEALSASMLFWRSFTHWLGGMGVLVLTIAILPMLGIGGSKIMRAETTGPTMDKAVASTTNSAKILYVIYFGFTLAMIVILKIMGLPFFDCCINAFGSIGTGGYSNYNASIGAYGRPGIEYAISFFMLLAGINFGLYASVFMGEPKKLFKDPEARTYLGVVAGASILIAVILTVSNTYTSFGESFRYSFFQVNSIITTTGFGTADFNLWPLPCRIILLLLMFMGGSGGSTAGGLKVIRFMIAFKLIKRGIQRRLHPNALAPVKVGGKSVNPEVLSGVTNVMLLYAATALISTLIISLQGFGLTVSFTSVISALSNIGPGFDFVNYSIFNGASKILFSLLMIAGRLELYTIVLMFTPGFWNKNR